MRQIIESFSGGGDSAFLWQQGVMTDLNDLVDSKARMDITAAHAINGAGWIACQGTDEDGDVVGILPRPVESPPGDVNCDGSVYLDDLGILIDAWGACSPLES